MTSMLLLSSAGRNDCNLPSFRRCLSGTHQYVLGQTSTRGLDNYKSRKPTGGGAVTAIAGAGVAVAIRYRQASHGRRLWEPNLSELVRRAETHVFMLVKGPSPLREYVALCCYSDVASAPDVA